MDGWEQLAALRAVYDGYLEEYRYEELRDRLPQRTVTWRMVAVDDLACGEAFQRQLAHPTAAGWQG